VVELKIVARASNQEHPKPDRQDTAAAARVKLKPLYPAR
jgi:hypothetical protein